MKAGDRAPMSFPRRTATRASSTGRTKLILDREHNRHVAFGAGIHRCAGSNLARLELRVALQTFLERIPEFELEDPAAVTWRAARCVAHGSAWCASDVA